MGLLFVLVKMSVVLNIYAFLGQRSKAVSFKKHYFSVDGFVLFFSSNHVNADMFSRRLTPGLY